MNHHQIISTAALFGMLAVLLGAFGAHGLEKLLPDPMLQRYHTGVEYQFYHALALLLTAVYGQHNTQLPLGRIAIAFTMGIILFSGSLYAYALTGIRSFGMITPIGGLSFIAGWSLLCWHSWRLGKKTG